MEMFIPVFFLPSTEMALNVCCLLVFDIEGEDYILATAFAQEKQDNQKGQNNPVSIDPLYYQLRTARLERSLTR